MARLKESFLVPWTLVALALLAAAAPGRGAEGDVDVVIASPGQGTVISGGGPEVRVEGRIQARRDLARPRLDLMFVIDTSGSTGGASGVDVNGNGVVGRMVDAPKGAFLGPDRVLDDPDDSILAAEVAAAERLLLRLDPETTRVGVTRFSGPLTIAVLIFPIPVTSAAVLEQPLTSDFARVREALARVRAWGSARGTDMAAGIRLAARELAGLPGHESEPDPGGQKVALLLTDGHPTLPFGRGDEEDPRDIEAAIAAAREAAGAGVAIHTFGLGPDALGAPRASMEVARVTGGTYTPLQTPGHVIVALGRAVFADLDLAVLTNATTGIPARQLTVDPEGRFWGLVPLAPGENRLQMRVLTRDGGEGKASVLVTYRPERGLDIELSRENRELERWRDRLRQETRDLELALERRQAADREQHLEIEIRRR